MRTREHDEIERLLSIRSEWMPVLRAAEDAGLIEIAPVAVPGDAYGDNNHIGWPVATATDGSLVVAHRRIPGHNPRGAGAGDERSTFTMITTSTDHGETWSESVDIREFMGEQRNRGGVIPLSHRYKFGPVNESDQGYKLHLNAIGTGENGRVHLLCNYGAFRSDDRGRTWTHLAEAFREDTYSGDIIYLGPRIVTHPSLGLLAFGNTAGYGRSDRFPNPVPGPIEHGHPTLVVLRSVDDGESWDTITMPLPEWAGQHEPAAMVHEGEVLVIGRDQLTRTDHLQMRFKTLDEHVDVQRTNMRNERYIDTVDLDFNPVSGRIEVIRSRRESMRLELFSIDPADWEHAEWRLEARLFDRTGDFYSTGDGFHPAGAVIDPERGVQHVFIYTGHPNGPAGSFRLTRSLDTETLSSVLSP